MKGSMAGATRWSMVDGRKEGSVDGFGGNSESVVKIVFNEVGELTIQA